ncbi:putative E3 ubiquitin-protein ligase RING1a [Vicia villosa]|uniref:putative E3 ubiquitin-protein ligase RING1a n=1 Tax=Vicia villosa TaxID=3911 RepID=UPI00273B73E6|nr:putative E3 ubiquitin-protein ligase RING1a [Vicia villosa]
MSKNQHSHVVEESLQEIHETKNEVMNIEEKSKNESGLTQRQSSKNEEEVDEKEIEEVDEDEVDEEEEEVYFLVMYLRLDSSSFRKDVECPICLGIIQNTVTAMKCLHRFCRECIHKSIRLGKKECPTCRVHCPSKRSMRDDPSFDAIIEVLYPNIDKSEKEVRYTY